MQRNKFGVWEVFIPDLPNGKCAIEHQSKIKILLVTPSGEYLDRLPAWSRRVVQDLSVSPLYESVFWNPPQPYQWKNQSSIAAVQDLRIYEAHGKWICMRECIKCHKWAYPIRMEECPAIKSLL